MSGERVPADTEVGSSERRDELLSHCSRDPRWAARQIRGLADMVADRDRIIDHPLVQACLAMNPHILAHGERPT